jgi:NAD+ synthase
MTAELTRTLPDELQFDHERVANLAVAFLQRRLDAANLDTYVLGLSGGVDSACAAALAVRAIGPERLVTVKIPAPTSSPSSRADAEAVEDVLGIPREHRLLVEVGPIVDGWRTAVGDPDPPPLRRGNVAARARMVVLWDLAAKHHGIVLGAENRTEGLLGYFTIYGDAGTAVEPIAGLFKSQVWSLSRHLGVPRQVIEKPPSADLWVGQTDETELGARYDDADRVLYWSIDRGLAPGQIAARTGLPRAVVDRVLGRYHATAFKREIPYRLDIPVTAVEC